ncbi:MAG: hypothetical protein KIPDCIKN_01267 [Haliscomenobacter sp.]|jgi:hypothetical protein|nr:hypothetical protein [Haliscomenobacter sp.]
MKLLSVKRSADAGMAIQPNKQTKKNLFDPAKKGFQELQEFSGIFLGKGMAIFFAEKAAKKSVKKTKLIFLKDMEKNAERQALACGCFKKLFYPWPPKNIPDAKWSCVIRLEVISKL